MLLIAYLNVAISILVKVVELVYFLDFPLMVIHWDFDEFSCEYQHDRDLAYKIVATKDTWLKGGGPCRTDIINVVHLYFLICGSQ